jgi:DNA helicase II / ATP-dependent DNA helicase PcrA
LFNVGRRLRAHGVPVIGPGARPYKRTHIFAGLAEGLAAHMVAGTRLSFERLQLALLFTIRDLRGEMDWSVHSYTGRVLLCEVLVQLRTAPRDCLRWLTIAAKVTADRLARGMKSSAAQVEILEASAAAMLADMQAQGVDPSTTTIEAIGMFAQPETALHLLTMHKAKGREFDAVAIIDLHDGRVPDFRATTEADIAEGRRLLYVAVTRARRVLMYFTDSSHRKNRPSRFLGRDGLGLV